VGLWHYVEFIKNTSGIYKSLHHQLPCWSVFVVVVAVLN